MKGRHWMAIWLFFFLGVLGWVVTRQTASVVLASQLRETRAQRSRFEGLKADLLRRVRSGSSRSVLIPRVQARGLRLPADSEIIILQAPSSEQR